MRRTKPLRSSTFRLTLAYLGLFGLSSAIILATIFYMSARFNDQQVRAVIEEEAAWLNDQWRTGGMPELQRFVAERSAVEPNRRAIYLLLSPLGTRLAGNLSGWPDGEPTADGYIEFPVDVHEGGSGPPKSHPAKAKVFANRRRLSPAGRPRRPRPRPDRSSRCKTAIFLGIGAIVVLGLLGGLILSRWMLTRLERINRSTTRIMAGEFGRRIATDGNGDEFDDLAQNLNAMLDRIERLLAGMRQVSEDIAHDLRTPLNRMRSRIEVALMGAPDTDEARGLLEDTLRDADGLIETFNALLAIARAEAGCAARRLGAAGSGRAGARRGRALRAAGRGGARSPCRLDARDGAIILGHRQLVAQAIANIADNAIKYTPPGGTVTITTAAQPVPSVTVDRHRPRASRPSSASMPSSASCASTSSARRPAAAWA